MPILPGLCDDEANLEQRRALRRPITAGRLCWPAA